MPEIKKHVSLITKSNEKQSIEKTRQELSQVNPEDSQIIDVQNKINEAIVIQSESDNEKRIKSAIEDKLGNGYVVKVLQRIMS